MKQRRNDIPLNTARAVTLLDEAAEWMEDLDGITERNVLNNNNKAASARKAEISRRLLYAAHLADAARLEIMNQYFTFKGEETPTVIPNGGNDDDRAAARR
jgi:hypothetical protein